MTIEQKIAQILAESQSAKESKLTEEQQEGHLETDGVTSVEGENPDNARNNVDNEDEAANATAEDKNIVKANAAPAEPTNLTGGMQEDIAALVNGEELSEEFKQKASTIFEAAVLSRVKQEVAKLDEAYKVSLDEQVEQIIEGLVEKVDGYLDYVVEQWMEQNEIALESGMKSDILEGFVNGLKGLFEEHYIEVPEEKFDVLGSMQEQIDSLNAKLNEQFESNVALKGQLAEFQIDKIAAQLAEGLVDTDKEKFMALVEELDTSSVDTFEKKAQVIRENYFTNKATTPVVKSVVTDTPITISEDKALPTNMKLYTSVLDNLK